MALLKRIESGEIVTPSDEALAEVLDIVTGHPDSYIRETFCGMGEQYREILERVAALEHQ